MLSNRVAIIGGAGFIGSHVNKYLKTAGYQTVILDNLSSGDLRTIPDTPFIHGDTGSKKDLEQLFSRGPFAFVVHLAALIRVGESVEQPARYYRNNVTHTLNLLDVMVKYKSLRLVFSSSAAVYGVPITTPLVESHPCHPINPYGETKWIVEKVLHSYDQAYGLKSMCLRYFNAAGGDPEAGIKNYHLEESNLIPIVLRSVLKGERRATLNGTDYPTPDGTCVRDYIHVWDLARAHLLAGQHLQRESKSQIYNLGNGLGYSVEQVLQAIERVTQIKLERTQGPRREGDPAVLIADASKAKKELGWEPEYREIDAIVSDAWRAML